MSHPNARRPLNARPKGHPLSSLLLLVTVLAAALACADVVRARQAWDGSTGNNGWEVVVLFGGAGLVGAGIGAVVGFFSPSIWRGLLYGSAGGFLAGNLTLLILAAPAPPFRSLAAVLVLLACTVAMGWRTR